MVFAVAILNRRAIKGSNELDTSDSTLTSLRSTKLFIEDGVAKHAHVFQGIELVQLVKAMPVVD